jgi:hypothetical protein
MRHDTKSPLTCCPRCHRAELLGRAARRPVFHYEKTDGAEGPPIYDVYHGEQHVAALRRKSANGAPSYEVRVTSPDGDRELSAGSLRGARALAEETYTASWRDGAHNARGPVREI